MNGHPEHIQNELGVHKHIFGALLDHLGAMGFRPSQNITLKEQLIIYIYIHVSLVYQSGMYTRDSSIQWRQHLSKFIFCSCSYTDIKLHSYFLKMLVIFSLMPFCTDHVHLLHEYDTTPTKIYNNSRFYPFFRDTLHQENSDFAWL